MANEKDEFFDICGDPIRYVPEESDIRDLISEVQLLRQEFGDHVGFDKIERGLGKLLPPVSGRFNVKIPDGYTNRSA